MQKLEPGGPKARRMDALLDASVDRGGSWVKPFIEIRLVETVPSRQCEPSLRAKHKDGRPRLG
jgi:hypothetical protein